MRAGHAALILAVLGAAACGPADEPPAIQLAFESRALEENIKFYRVAFHMQSRGCLDLRAEPLARALVFVEGRVDALQQDAVQIDQIRAGTYTVIAVGGPEREQPLAFGCAPNQQIVDGERAEISLELRSLR